MKICPRCRKTYPDDNLNFCLEDGSVLEQATSEAMPATVMMNEPRITEPTRQVQTPQYQVQPAQPQWNTAPQPYSMQPKKSSKTWIWVLLILGVLALLCGGGVVGLFIIGSQGEFANSSTSTTPTPKKGSTTSSPTNSKTNGTNTSTTTSNTSDRTDVEKVDLSEWVRTTSLYGNTEFSNGEFFMSSKQKGFYYVLAAPADTDQTENANTTVTLRNVDNADSRLGYGLVFHSNPTPLQQGYAFLIDSKKQKYRVVHHSPQKEDAVITWTKSDAIKPGTEENTLEVRDLPGKIELYINGTLVNTIKNDYGYAGGVVGLYSGDAAKIAFKDLELRK